MNSDKLKCGLCSLLLDDPVALKCGQTLCQIHLLTTKTPTFFCSICLKYHQPFEVPKANDGVISEIINLLKSNPESAIGEAKTTIKLLENDDPEYYVYEHFEQVKQQVDLRREMLKVKILTEVDEYSNKLIETLNKEQSECMGFARAIDYTGKRLDETDRNELKKAVEKYEKIPINEEEFERVNRQILGLKFHCDKTLDEYQQKFIRGKYKFQFADYNISGIFGTIEKRKVAETRRNVNEEEELFKQIHETLNRLTQQNYKKMAAILINLPITTEHRLVSLVEIIFEKSIHKPELISTFSQLSKVLFQIKVPSNNDPHRNVNFRTLLLTRCQNEFDSAEYEEIYYKKNELADSELGNILFIGELFKLGILTEGIIKDCVERLLITESDHNLECLCLLLTSIGKEIDRPINITKMNEYFNRLENIAATKDRTRGKLLEIIALRKKNWIQ